MRKTRQNRLFNLRLIDVYIVVWFCLNLFFLTQFPFMHSDESWLSGLTRTMMHEGLGSTEYFFDLLPRYPHAIKILFHMAQMGFITVFGYNLFAVRLMSLVFGTASLYAFYGLVRTQLKPTFSVLAVTALSLNIQFIYASHFARQEIVIVAVLVFCLSYYIKNKTRWTIKQDILMGTLIGLTIGVHPSSFIVALGVGAIYLGSILTQKEAKLRNLAVLIGTVTLFAGVFVAISFTFNPTFLPDYLIYGDDLGTTNSLVTKVFGWPKFYERLISGTNVTYYLPNIRIMAFVFAGILALSLFGCFSKMREQLCWPLLMLLGINVGYLIIGRYSQPTIIFIFPFIIYLIFLWIDRIKKIKYWVAGIVLAGTLVLSILGISPYLTNDYTQYIENIKKLVPEDAEVLANLNAEYAFDDGKLHDYRNLAYFDENNMSFEEYIETYEIAYIIYPQEMDFIYENRPIWNVLYGNTFGYYDEMNAFFNDHCVLVGSFKSPYAMRIADYMEKEPWTIAVYQVTDK